MMTTTEGEINVPVPHMARTWIVARVNGAKEWEIGVLRDEKSGGEVMFELPTRSVEDLFRFLMFHLYAGK